MVGNIVYLNKINKMFKPNPDKDPEQCIAHNIPIITWSCEDGMLANATHSSLHSHDDLLNLQLLYNNTFYANWMTLCIIFVHRTRQIHSGSGRSR